MPTISGNPVFRHPDHHQATTGSVSHCHSWIRYVLQALMDRALWALRTWLDSWSGIGHIAVGMHRQGFDLQLTQYDERGWRASARLCSS
jgi:hypothetical protein